VHDRTWRQGGPEIAYSTIALQAPESTAGVEDDRLTYKTRYCMHGFVGRHNMQPDAARGQQARSTSCDSHTSCETHLHKSVEESPKQVDELPREIMHRSCAAPAGGYIRLSQTVDIFQKLKLSTTCNQIQLQPHAIGILRDLRPHYTDDNCCRGVLTKTIHTSL
jgi:hypothetical protein